MQTLISQSEHKDTTQALDEAVSACSGDKYETLADFITFFKNDVNGI